MRSFILGKTVVTVHSGNKVEKILNHPDMVRELTKEEIEGLGENAKFAGPHNTFVDKDGKIAFDFDDKGYLEELAIGIRSRRNKLLEISDWRYLTGNNRYQNKAWDIYRQALRDITNQKSFPKEVVWPEPPLT